jgi:hypothetical protein
LIIEIDCKERWKREGDIEMNRLKKTIATAVTTLMIMTAFALLAVGEAEAKSKAPFDKGYLPPGNMAKARRSAKLSAPKGGVWKAAKVIDRDGKFLGLRTPRRSGILPYIEQDNLYR